MSRVDAAEAKLRVKQRLDGDLEQIFSRIAQEASAGEPLLIIPYVYQTLAEGGGARCPLSDTHIGRLKQLGYVVDDDSIVQQLIISWRDA